MTAMSKTARRNLLWQWIVVNTTPALPYFKTNNGTNQFEWCTILHRIEKGRNMAAVTNTITISLTLFGVLSDTEGIIFDG